MNNLQEIISNTRIALDFCTIETNVCNYHERTLSFALGVEIPTQAETPTEIFKECCYRHVVLADLNSDSEIKNDYSSFYHQRTVSNETADFYLVRLSDDSETLLNTPTYGTFYDFGSLDNNSNLKGFLLDWKKVLLDLGIGAYKVIKKSTIVGVETITEYLTYNLEQYTDFRANGTVRIDVRYSGKLLKSGVDFSGVNWKDSIRVLGFFGNREVTYEEDVLVRGTYEKEQISIQQTNEFKFQSGLIPSCITDTILDYLLLADDLRFTDYNLNNHSYGYRMTRVNISSNEGTDYGPRRRRARLNLIFTDSNLLTRKENFK